MVKYTGLLKIPAVLQRALLQVLRCAVGVQYVSNLCMILPDLRVLKIALIKIILGV